MNSLPSDDPLVSLWQTAPKPDTQHLLQDLKRLNRLHRGMNRSVLAILCGLSLLFLFEEATGRLATHGALSALWIVGLIAGVARRRRSRCKRADALALDTVSLLKSMIARAKSDLFLARCLYAGVPCGAAAGALAVKLVGTGSPAIGVDARLRLIQTGAGAAALIVMVGTGAVLARSRRQQVRELSEKLRVLQTDL